jgi:hypothetical protein
VTSNEAKQILLLHRGPDDEAAPEVREALALAQNDAELHAWLRAQKKLHEQLRTSFRQLPVPGDLTERILAGHRAKRMTWMRRYPAWAAAAAVIAALAVVFLNRTFDDQSFSTFRSRMVRSVLRQYQMDIETNSMPVIRQFLSTNQAPSNYVLTPGLNRLAPRGAGLQRWLGHRVSMVCLDAPAQGTAILFIVDANTMKNPPAATPTFRQVSKLMTASWSTQGRAYLLMVDNPMIDRTQLQRLL